MKNPNNPNNSGAVIRLFGVILIILGGLNTMLSWRGGFEVAPFQMGLFATGLLLCLIGGILRHKATVGADVDRDQCDGGITGQP
ncbi:MAG: hypothetical protein HOK21_18780 [Rhodospirillaceae bacterium]|jgi:hypothetical protein|nr:hypothetical protein [Rhodospirillaceae bacterium]MBT4046478.1 hypothetical protein [Rhodospirillaceae bacterium]MBT4689356.1 hypothetical protein [Rhodospirillaceae bacterium]MBT5083104.1 hypothetical protein [Rhodospirillaceae bacterium]MBT5526134.1 hypothetical protein [Rhodospirillaceae bacterium]